MDGSPEGDHPAQIAPKVIMPPNDHLQESLDFFRRPDLNILWVVGHKSQYLVKNAEGDHPGRFSQHIRMIIFGNRWIFSGGVTQDRSHIS
jgi:hypothetical protein